MSRFDIGHRFCNQDFGKDGHLRDGNVSVEGRNYYSYSTIFAQWLDQKKKVVVVYHGKTSSSSSKHQLDKWMFPDDVHVLPYDDHYRKYKYGYAGCSLIWHNRSDDDFKYEHRVTLLDYYIDVQFRQFEYLKVATTKGDENVSFLHWDYAIELCSLYKDTSIQKWLKIKGRNSDDDKLKKKMAKMLLKGERDVQTITDSLFGEGTFSNYMGYSERFKKADKKRAQMEWLCNRLGIRSPYLGDSYYRGGKIKMTAKEIRKLTAKERNRIHFNYIAWKAWDKQVDVRQGKYNKNKRNAYVWIVGSEPVIATPYRSSYQHPHKVVDKYTGKVYNVGDWSSLKSVEWCSGYVDFDYDSFRKSEDKELWIRSFYEKCQRISECRIALGIFDKVNANSENGSYSWYHRYIDDEHLVASTTPEEYAICKKFIERQEKFYADLEAQRRAEAIRRQREEEERKREKELQERITREQINSCINEGADGCRKLWRMHFTSINEAMERFKEVAFADEGSFYSGGNVLMRFNMDKTIVETSKNIRLDIATCKKFWRLINIWHNDPSKFKQCKIDTHYSGTYMISSFKDDILTAGCHKIAYSEMERMYNAIVELERIA